MAEVKSECNENHQAMLWAVGALLVLAFFVLPLFWPLPLIDPDEGLHAAIAQEIVEQNDWITPRLLDQPFLDKPILYTWAQAGSLSIFGMHVVSVRLPGMLFGFLGLVCTGVIACRMFGRSVGLLAGSMYASMMLPLALTQSPTHDVALVPWVGLSILLFWEIDRSPSRRNRIRLTLAVGLVLGLSILTKGLIGMALVGVAYGGSLLIRRRLSVAVLLRGLAALAISALVASPWYLAMEVRNPGYLNYYFVERHLQGFVTSTQRHGGEPFWYYVPIMMLGCLPWVAYLPIGFRQWRHQRRPHVERLESRGAITLILCWLIGGLLLLSAASSKLITYVWPLLPAVAILAALVWDLALSKQLIESARRSLARNFCFSSITGPLMPIGILIAVGLVFEARFSPLAWIAAAMAGACSFFPVVLWSRGRHREALMAGMTALAPQFLVILLVAAPHAAQANTARDLAVYFNQQGEIPSRVVIVEERVGSLIFYLDPSLRTGLNVDRIQTLRAMHLAEFLKNDPDALIVIAEQRMERVSRYLDLSDTDFQRAGRYRLYPSDQLETDHEPVRPSPATDSDGHDTGRMQPANTNGEQRSKLPAGRLGEHESDVDPSRRLIFMMQYDHRYRFAGLDFFDDLSEMV